MPESPMELIYEGSVKNVYRDIHTQGINYFAFTDDYSVFDWGKMPDTIAQKGRALAILGGSFFNRLTPPAAWQTLPQKTSLAAFDPTFLSTLFTSETFKRVSQTGLQHHFLGWVDAQGQSIPAEALASQEQAPLMKVRSIDVTRPQQFTLDQLTLYNYDMLNSSCTFPFLIPLEVIFRFGMPEGSSLGERLGQNPHYYAELGLTTPPQENVLFDRPVVEFFTKLEPKDRYLTPQEAFLISGLNEAQFIQLYQKTLLIALWLYDAFSQAGITLWDGKLEFGWTPEGLMLVDSIGPDELRLKTDGVHLSKEALRQFYRGTPWEKALKIAKEASLSQPGSDWREICIHNQGQTPEPLSPEAKRIADNLYGALTNHCLGETLIPTAMNFSEVVSALAQQPIGAVR